MKEGIPDIQYEIFRECLATRVTGALVVEKDGVLSGILEAEATTKKLGMLFESSQSNGEDIRAGQIIARVEGNPVQIARAEDEIIGRVSKASGIATAARRARVTMSPRCRVVSGGWKKMPLEIKALVRQAVLDGGLEIRICDEPFVYLDKNYVRILGGVKKAIKAVRHLKRTVVVQIRGETGTIWAETIEAAETGADVIMVDTGRIDDVEMALRALEKTGMRPTVRVAFAGNITIEKLKDLSNIDLDAVDIGYAILDAPCLPMRFDVIALSSN